MESNHRESDSFEITYDETPEMFGHPYKELQDFFKKYSTRGNLLDLGCGQGRDSLFLAAIGYHVTAVDSSKVGVGQMIKKAQSQGFEIDGIVADVQDLKLEEKFDVILFDMLLHTFEKSKQLELLKKYSSYLNEKGVISIVFPDDLTTEHFTNMLKSLLYNWKLIDEITIRDVPKIKGENNDFTFKMIVVHIR